MIKVECSLINWKDIVSPLYVTWNKEKRLKTENQISECTVIQSVPIFSAVCSLLDFFILPSLRKRDMCTFTRWKSGDDIFVVLSSYAEGSVGGNRQAAICYEG